MASDYIKPRRVKMQWQDCQLLGQFFWSLVTLALLFISCLSCRVTSQVAWLTMTTFCTGVTFAAPTRRTPTSSSRWWSRQSSSMTRRSNHSGHPGRRNPTPNDAQRQDSTLLKNSCISARISSVSIVCYKVGRTNVKKWAQLTFRERTSLNRAYPANKQFLRDYSTFQSSIYHTFCSN